MRTFLLLLIAKTVSHAGSHLTGFGLGVWVYQRTDSVALYSLLLLCSQLPPVLVSPWAGTLTDTWDRRKTLILAHAGGGVCSVLLLLSELGGGLELGTAMALSAALACFNAFDFPAFSALTTTLVPRDQLARANGLVQAGTGGVQLIAPLAAGLLLPVLGLKGLLAIDALSFLFSLSVLLMLRVAPQAAPGPRKRRSVRVFIRDAGEGWRFVRQRRGLMSLLLLSSSLILGISMVQVLVTPLVLSFSDASTLGLVDSLGGVGFLAGSLAMLAWRRPQRLVHGILGFALLEGVLLVVLGTSKPSVILAAVGAFGVLFTFPITGACNQTLWQRQVPLELQGRVFALRTMASRLVISAASPLAGPLADAVFEPLMARDGALAPVLGAWMGTGPGRGTALLIACLGLLTMLFALLGFSSSALRRLEDSEPESPPASATGTPA